MKSTTRNEHERRSVGGWKTSPKAPLVVMASVPVSTVSIIHPSGSGVPAGHTLARIRTGPAPLTCIRMR